MMILMTVTYYIVKKVKL